jgi:2-phosphosulfolactate phosphatase
MDADPHVDGGRRPRARPRGVQVRARAVIRFGWGRGAIEAGDADIIVVVDVLSFCTAVDVALARDCVVYPYRWRDASGQAFADERDALLAGTRGETEWSLSPAVLRTLPIGARLVLPSPNGATLCLAAREHAFTIAGCLRNAAAIARVCRDREVLLVAAGELDEHGHRRQAEEDLLGAGAIAAHLDRSTCSPEARAAAAAFERARHDLPSILRASISGRELADRGFTDDIDLAAELDASDLVPIVDDDHFTVTGTGSPTGRSAAHRSRSRGSR